MANQLTGDFDVVAQFSLPAVNRLLAAMHGIKRFPHSLSLRVDDVPRSSDPGRIGLRGFPDLPHGRPFERLQRRAVINVDHAVELIGEVRIEVVASKLGLRAVDHADRPMPPWLAQTLCECIVKASSQEEPRVTNLVEDVFDASRERIAHSLSFRDGPPVGRCRDGALVGREPHEEYVVRTVSLPYHLAHVELAAKGGAPKGEIGEDRAAP